MNKTVLAILLFSLSSFGARCEDLTIRESIRMALDNNVKMKNALLDIEIASETQKQAFTAYFPQVSAMGVYFKAKDPLIQKELDLSAIGGILSSLGMDPAALGLPSAYPLNLLDKGTTGVVTVMQPVFAGGQIVIGNKLSRLGREVAEMQADMSRNEVVTITEKYFWQIIALQEKLASLEAVETMLAETEKAVKASVDAGVILDSDLTKVEIQKGKIKSSKRQLENGITVLKMVFAQFIGADSTDFQLNGEDIYTIAQPNDIFVPENDAVNLRTESKLLDKGVEAARLQRKMEVGKNLPTIAVGGAAIYMDMMDTRSDNILGMVTVAIPLSGWWKGSHAIREAKLKEQKAINERENNIALLEVDIRSKWNNLLEAYDLVQIARDGVEASRKDLSRSRQQYEQGVIVLRDYLESQMQYKQDESALVDALVNYRTARLDYMAATGTLPVES